VPVSIPTGGVGTPASGTSGSPGINVVYPTVTGGILKNDIALLFAVIKPLASTTSPALAPTGASGGWGSLSNVLTSNGLYTTDQADAGSSGNDLYVTPDLSTIPSAAIITNIAVSVLGYYTGTGTAQLDTSDSLGNGGVIHPPKTTPGTQTINFPGSWTKAQLAGYQLDLYTEEPTDNGPVNVYVDYVSVAITYNVPRAQPPAGWTLKSAMTGGTNLDASIWWRRMNGGESGNVLTNGSPNKSLIGTIIIFRGVTYGGSGGSGDTTDPFDVIAANGAWTAITTTPITVASQTPSSTNGAWYGFVAAGSNSSTGDTISLPAAWTSLGQVNRGASGNYLAVLMASKDSPPNGGVASGTVAVTWGPTGQNAVGVQLALKVLAAANTDPQRFAKGIDRGFGVGLF
jgi:hypothetical protein